MTIIVQLDPNQKDTSIRVRIANCPQCGQKLFEVESIAHRGVFRLKCRRCRAYVRAVAEVEKDDLGLTGVSQSGNCSGL